MEGNGGERHGIEWNIYWKEMKIKVVEGERSGMEGIEMEGIDNCNCNCKGTFI